MSGPRNTLKHRISMTIRKRLVSGTGSRSRARDLMATNQRHRTHQNKTIQYKRENKLDHSWFSQSLQSIPAFASEVTQLWPKKRLNHPLLNNRAFALGRSESYGRLTYIDWGRHSDRNRNPEQRVSSRFPVTGMTGMTGFYCLIRISDVRVQCTESVRLTSPGCLIHSRCQGTQCSASLLTAQKMARIDPILRYKSSRGVRTGARNRGPFGDATA